MGARTPYRAPQSLKGRGRQAFLTECRDERWPGCPCGRYVDRTLRRLYMVGDSFCAFCPAFDEFVLWLQERDVECPGTCEPGVDSKHCFLAWKCPCFRVEHPVRDEEFHDYLIGLYKRRREEVPRVEGLS